MSSYVFVKQRLHPGLLDSMVRGGAQAIEIFCARQHFDYSSRQHIGELAGWFKSNPVTLHSLHSPLYSDDSRGQNGGADVNIASIEKRERIDAMDEIKRAIEVAEILPFRYLIQHIGKFDESFSGRKFDATMTCIEHLRAFAKPLQVQILLENIPNELSTAEKLVELIKILRFEDLQVCFDFGHAHICGRHSGGIAPQFETLKSYIRSVNLHDNTMELKDDHLWPGEGSIDWDATMRLLRTAPQVPPLLLEINGGDEPGGSEVEAKMAAAYKKLEVAGQQEA